MVAVSGLVFTNTQKGDRELEESCLHWRDIQHDETKGGVLKKKAELTFHTYLCQWLFAHFELSVTTANNPEHKATCTGQKHE